MVTQASPVLKAALSDSTNSMYNSSIQQYAKFVEFLQLPIPIFPADPGILVLFISKQLSQGLSPATITSKMSALSYYHKINGMPDPTQQYIVKSMLTGARKIPLQANS